MGIRSVEMNIKNKIPAAFAMTITLMLVCFSALAAMTLDEAKQSGLVGEDASGYIAAVARPTGEIRALVSSVNDKRLGEYERIAIANNLDVSAVEKLAGKKTIELTPAGSYIRMPGDNWQRK
ncbi:MAG: hypothetical protein ACJAVI_002153 [Candidatus Azotimanducaceae bacterium]|jgi:uncharacterized protein YdbL (DUF1318 family)